MQDFLWLLLPVAAASGWWAALRNQRDNNRDVDRHTTPAYFKGFNYLLNEEPDKAIDVFVQLLEIDSETIETHLALGSLFRRRGEVERAIRIHQNLIARPALDQEQRSQALLELGMDYMRAGLYDRAENLFKELKNTGYHVRKALENLLIIYQQERDWQACLETSAALQPLVSESLCLARSHYYCELAEQAHSQGDMNKVQQLLDQAIASDGSCVRPIHMQARICIDQQQYEQAIRLLHQIVERDRDYLPEVLFDLRTCYQKMDDMEGLKQYLLELLNTKSDQFLILELTDIIQETEGDRSASIFLGTKMRKHPSLRGLLRLIELHEKHYENASENILWGMKSHIQHLLSERSAFQCNKCGFVANTLHWQCPSCRSWSSIRRKTSSEDKCL